MTLDEYIKIHGVENIEGLKVVVKDFRDIVDFESWEPLMPEFKVTRRYDGDSYSIHRSEPLFYSFHGEDKIYERSGMNLYVNADTFKDLIVVDELTDDDKFLNELLE